MNIILNSCPSSWTHYYDRIIIRIFSMFRAVDKTSPCWLRLDILYWLVWSAEPFTGYHGVE